MPKKLVIVESPAKSKTISKYLGREYTVKATMGHIRDLPEKELGVDIENGFKPRYIPSRGKRKVLKMLKDEAARADAVFLAPDPDREGEAIAWHVQETIRDVNKNIKRVMFNEITKKAVLAAIDSAHDIDMNKVNAQQARRILDRVVGYQISPVLWRTVFRGLSAGRVQSVALRLICEREDEIRAFVQEEFWTIHASLRADQSRFGAKLLRVDGEKAHLANEEQARALVERVQSKPFAVSKVVRTRKARKPYAPFITSTLQQDASRKLGFSAARTMVVAQQLYEGLELGAQGSTGLITYMRTDSTRVSDEAVEAARAMIVEQFDKEHVPAAPRTYGKSKNAQDAHEAIRPAQVAHDFSPEQVKEYLSRDQLRLYTLIWRRFLASQMSDAQFDSTRVDIDVDNCLFRATGSIMKFEGFLALYDESREEGGGESGDGDNERLPELADGTPLACEEVAKKQHFTQPPARYTEALLVRELEDKGIGRPSTYAQIIDTLKRREYVTMASRRFVPTEIGYTVREILIREFPSVFDVRFTAEMESELDKVEEGRAHWVEVLGTFYTPFQKVLGEVSSRIKEIRSANQEVTDRTCPGCGKNPLVVKWSRNGKFLACQGFPECKYTEPLDSDKVKPQPSNETCEKCGAPMVILAINNSRFLGCSRYPECRNTKSIPLGVGCPQPGCGGDLVERRTRRGKVFYGCNKYPVCTFASWDEPINQPCPACSAAVLYRKVSRRKGAVLRCLSCRSEFPVPCEEEGESGAQE